MYAIMANGNDVIVCESSEVSDNEKFSYEKASDLEYPTYKQAFREAVLLQDSE